MTDESFEDYRRRLVRQRTLETTRRLVRQGLEAEREFLRLSAKIGNTGIAPDFYRKLDELREAELSVGQTQRPPRSLEFTLECALAPAVADDVIGDIVERYQQHIVPKFGRVGGWLWFAAQTVRELAYSSWLSPFLRRLMKWGGITTAASAAIAYAWPFVLQWFSKFTG